MTRLFQEKIFVNILFSLRTNKNKIVDVNVRDGL